MFAWIYSVRNQPEGTRRTIAFLIFFGIAGAILTVWLWNVKGAFPYQSVVTTTETAGTAIGEQVKKFQEFQKILGQYKEDLINIVSRDVE